MLFIGIHIKQFFLKNVAVPQNIKYNFPHDQHSFHEELFAQRNSQHIYIENYIQSNIFHIGLKWK